MADASPSPEKRCNHGFKASAIPCPHGCHPEAFARMSGAPSSQEQAELLARRAARKTEFPNSGAKPGNNGAPRSGRNHHSFIDLEGKTKAGCLVGRMAAAATNKTRWHATMACGHAQICDGSAILAADKAGRILNCDECRKSNRKTKGKRK